MENNKLLDKLFENKPLLLSLLGLLILIIILLLFLSIRDRSNRFQLEAVNPQNGSTINAQSAHIEFDFNQEMPLVQADTFEVVVEPEIEYTYGILNDKISITFNDLLLVDNQTYTVTVSNILSRNEEVVRNVNSTFTVDLEENTVKFLDNLPLSEKGFSVVKISDHTLFVRITDEPENKYLEDARELLENKGLYSSLFNVDYSLPSEQSGFNEQGVRH